jgi:hypothetical protein
VSFDCVHQIFYLFLDRFSLLPTLTN